MFRATSFAVVAIILSTVISLVVEWLIGRRLAAWEMVVSIVSIMIVLVAWEIKSFLRRQARNRLLGMRDSALW